MKPFFLPILCLLGFNMLLAQGNALQFDGIDDYIQIDDYSLGNDFTISFWYKASDIPNANFDDRIIAFGPEWRLEIGLGEFDCGLENLWIADQLSNVITCYPVNVRDGQWHHVAFTKRGPNRIIYFDGNVIGGHLGDNDFAYGPRMRIGSWTGAQSTHTFYSGLLDEVRIWGEARTQVQIQEYMNCEMTGSEHCLATYYSFNQGEADVLNNGVDSLFDQATGENHGELRQFTLDGSTSNWVTSTAEIFSTCKNVDCLTTSLNTLEDPSIAIFPNPSKGLFDIQIEGTNTLPFVIRDIAGRAVVHGLLNQQTFIDIQDQPEGMYFLEIMDGDRRYVKKLIKHQD